MLAPSGRRRGNGLQILDKSIDLLGREMMLEAWHSRRAIADDLAHHVLASPGGTLSITLVRTPSSSVAALYDRRDKTG